MTRLPASLNEAVAGRPEIADYSCGAAVDFHDIPYSSFKEDTCTGELKYYRFLEMQRKQGDAPFAKRLISILFVRQA